MNTFDVYSQPEYILAMKHAEEFEESAEASHYKAHFCLKPITTGGVKQDTVKNAFDRLEGLIQNQFDQLITNTKRKLCILAKDHVGKCEFSAKGLFRKSSKEDKTVDKMLTSINMCVYSIPGDDDYVYKNRASRLFPIVISSKLEKKIRSKSTKLKCAIPLKEHSTPFMLASAYIDWMCYVINISDIDKHINGSMTDKYKTLFASLRDTHKRFLIDVFNKINKRAFNDDGFTICPVTGHMYCTKNVSDSLRDNRFEQDNNDVEMGHVVPKSDSQFTVRGMNVIMMTRVGNRHVGENDFRENVWLEDISRIFMIHCANVMSPELIRIKELEQQVSELLAEKNSITKKRLKIVSDATV
jgi:hypothetical protein